MRLHPNSFGMTLLLGLLSAMGPISTDLFVPALPQLTADLQTIPARAQWTMSGYLLGFAAGQIFYGPVADKYGRKPVLMVALCIYLVASLAGALALSIESLTAARVIQGLGGAGPIIVARSIVRDLYQGNIANQKMALISTVMGLAPIIAPLVGALLVVKFGWRSGFVGMFLAVLFMAIMAALFLPETIRKRTEGRLSFKNILAGFAIVGRNKIWRSYASLQVTSQTGLYTFIASSPFILQNVYGITPLQFGVAFSICSFAFATSALISSRVVARRGGDFALGIGVTMFAIAGVTQLAGILISPKDLLTLFIPELLYFGGVGFILPNAVAGSLSPFPDRAGAATSLAGFTQMIVSAAVGLFVVAMIDKSAMPLALSTFITALISVIIFLASKNARAQRTTRVFR